MINSFFINKGPFKIEDILIKAKIKNISNYKEKNIFDIKDLLSATNKDISFFHSKKYESAASVTKASYCITTKQLSVVLPKNCEPIDLNCRRKQRQAILQWAYSPFIWPKMGNKKAKIGINKDFF